MTILMNGAYFNSLDQDSGLENALDQIPGSGTTDYIIFSLNVKSKTIVDISFGLSGPTLASDGDIQDGFSDIIEPIISAGIKNKSLKRIWLSIGGAESDAFTYINDIISQNSDLTKTLYNNFNAIITAIGNIQGAASESGPVFSGFDIDFEQKKGDLQTLVSNVTIWLYQQFKCTFTFCPFQSLPITPPHAKTQAVSPWISSLSTIYSALNTQPVLGFNLQTYAGGYGNDPTAWVSAVSAQSGTSVADASAFIWPIFSCDSGLGNGPNSTPSQVTTAMQGWKSQGASLWATASLPYDNYNLSDYATAINAG
ncbi:hypothetical protein AZL_d04180 (plasmid) [Azospirillum sp. B510]|uniref:hypothetical protein n=1 Tax=Azospirillum sp. (strain B510) TaxID=137722 RepID=UPI0001C4CE1D|nr:hypothetical protein [Azospirillum sp. B510]BAI76244.1 hypothetical protein AZL_d04180 [Azospirillum sp. B510]